MIGILVVTHNQLGTALYESAESILGKKIEATVTVSINLAESAKKLRSGIDREIKNLNQGDGVLILTDMFGGTPSNLSYSFLEEGHIEVLSGVNLPIIVKAINSREKMNISELAQKLEEYGKKSISLASGILKGNKRS